MMTRTPPRILLLDDSPPDAERVIALLESAGLGGHLRRVGTAPEFLAAIDEQRQYDLILFAFSEPGLDWFEALKMARQSRPSIPFIFLSSRSGEQHAIEALRKGATDFVLKTHLDRLPLAVERALAESWERAERNRVELDLAEARRRSQAALIAGEVGTYAWDLSEDRVHGDENFLRIFDIQPDSDGAVKVIACLERIPEEDRIPVAERIAEAMATGDRLGAEYRVVSGVTERWVAGRARIERDANEKPIRINGVVLDITDRKRAELQLAEESKVVETINQVGRSLAAELEPQKIIQIVADATTELTTADIGAFIYNAANDGDGSPAMRALSGPRRDRMKDSAPGSGGELSDTAIYRQGVVRLDDVTADPSRAVPAWSFPVRSYLAVPVVSRSGAVLGGLFFGHEQPGIFNDRHERIVTGIAAQAAVSIDNAHLFQTAQRASAEKDKLLTSERSARAEAERASGLKDEFLATLSHELRTPLSAILGWTHVLRRQPKADSEIEEGLAIIERNARVQVQLVEDLLDMSRIISGKIRLDVQRVALSDVVSAACETVRPAADAKGVRIRKVLDPMAEPVSGDPNRLQQIVWNLLHNAVKFTPRNGKVDLLLQRINSHVEITVHDTGDGISPEFLPHVFDRFRQADGTTTRRHGGLGLGLSIVKHLVELHGGTISAKSPGLGKGSTFSVHLPIAPIRPEHQRHLSPTHTGTHHPTATVPGESEEGYPRLDGVSVLVVDDDPDARDLMRRVLSDCGADVLLATGASEALAMLRQTRPRVLVSDIGMPAHDGYELIRWIRALPEAEGGRTPAIALTAFARAEDRRRAVAAGYQTHLAKPADTGELITVVCSLAGVLPA